MGPTGTTPFSVKKPPDSCTTLGPLSTRTLPSSLIRVKVNVRVTVTVTVRERVRVRVRVG